MDHMKNKWQRVPRWEKIVGITIVGIIGVVAMGFLFGIGITLLWNWLMPELFNLKEITYWQAIGIFVLAKIIFGFGGSGEGNSKHRTATKEQGCENHSHTQKREVPKNWEYYDEWWESEGQKTFEGFVERRKAEIKPE
jgi:hypothetical protein